jgi:hypothetical protein
MSTITDTRLSMDHHHLSGPTHLDSTWSRLMEYPSRDRKSPVPQFPRFQAPMSPMHNFEPALKQETFRPTPPAETQRRTSEPTARKEGPIAEDKDHFDTSAGRAGWKLSMYQSPKSGKVSTGKEKGQYQPPARLAVPLSLTHIRPQAPRPATLRPAQRHVPGGPHRLLHQQ